MQQSQIHTLRASGRSPYASSDLEHDGNSGKGGKWGGYAFRPKGKGGKAQQGGKRSQTVSAEDAYYHRHAASSQQQVQ